MGAVISVRNDDVRLVTRGDPREEVYLSSRSEIGVTVAMNHQGRDIELEGSDVIELMKVGPIGLDWVRRQSRCTESIRRLIADGSRKSEVLESGLRSGHSSRRLCGLAEEGLSGVYLHRIEDARVEHQRGDHIAADLPEEVGNQTPLRPAQYGGLSRPDVVDPLDHVSQVFHRSGRRQETSAVPLGPSEPPEIDCEAPDVTLSQSIHDGQVDHLSPALGRGGEDEVVHGSRREGPAVQEDDAVGAVHGSLLPDADPVPVLSHDMVLLASGERAC